MRSICKPQNAYARLYPGTYLISRNATFREPCCQANDDSIARNRPAYLVV
jgi:hypothetical protein